MKNDLGTLRVQANIAANRRDHAIKWLAPWHGESRSLQNCICLHCDAEGQINTNPAANGIDIGGSIFAANCDYSKMDAELE